MVPKVFESLKSAIVWSPVTGDRQTASTVTKHLKGLEHFRISAWELEVDILQFGRDFKNIQDFNHVRLWSHSLHFSQTEVENLAECTEMIRLTRVAPPIARATQCGS